MFFVTLWQSCSKSHKRGEWKVETWSFEITSFAVSTTENNFKNFAKMNTIRQPSFERLWDDLELGDEEPLKVAKRFIYSRKLQPKYILITNNETRFPQCRVSHIDSFLDMHGFINPPLPNR